jgi:hypothetical protein
MLYIAVDSKDPNKLTYYCRHCGNRDASTVEEGVCVLDTQLKKGEQNFSHIINPYTKMDPTLPRIYNVRCPNMECKTNHSGAKEPAEIIYIRYDDDNMKYLYICCDCDTTWKTNDKING